MGSKSWRQRRWVGRLSISLVLAVSKQCVTSMEVCVMTSLLRSISLWASRSNWPPATQRDDIDILCWHNAPRSMWLSFPKGCFFFCNWLPSWRIKFIIITRLFREVSTAALFHLYRKASVEPSVNRRNGCNFLFKVFSSRVISELDGRILDFFLKKLTKLSPLTYNQTFDKPAGNVCSFTYYISVIVLQAWYSTFLLAEFLRISLNVIRKL